MQISYILGSRESREGGQGAKSPGVEGPGMYNPKLAGFLNPKPM